MGFSVSAKSVVRAGAVLALAGVALGAFGAHALKESLTAAGHVDTWKTAVQYHLIHALAIVAVGLAAGAGSDRGAPVSLWRWVFFADGILLFSGSLYWLSLGGPRWLGPVTPVGGVLFLLGWLVLALNPFSKNGTPAEGGAPGDGGRI
jgi:uncharacterized membrane protein YgdD (TMEM256/DUF423 family)